MNRERVAWRNMHKRCKYSAHYTSRGISVCDRWFDFNAFIADMGPCLDGMSLERIDNDRGYSPNNCRWATKKEQARNTLRTRWLTVNGATKSLAEWCELRGLNRKTVTKRLQLGWPVHAALEVVDGESL